MSRAAPTTTPAVPQEEPIFKRYSPHGEFPLSSIASLSIHILGVVLLAVLGWVASKYLFPDAKPIGTNIVALDEPAGGGGGKVEGKGDGPGVGPTEDTAPAPVDPEKPSSVPPPEERPKLQSAEKENLKVDFAGDPATQRLVDSGSEAVEALGRVTKASRDKLIGAISGQGRRGAGSGGGDGRGKGPGKGDGVGDGKGGEVTKRERRVLRWVLQFSTRTGEDYAAQLHALGAILAIPDEEGGYLVIRDLSQRPARPKAEDVSKIGLIFWIDDKPGSVRSLAGALGIRPVPQHIAAFFPLSLEQKLVQLETGFRGREEEDIRETRFDVFRSGGTYDVRVNSQR